MGINKVVLGNETLIDLTQDTIQPDKLCTGYTAHDHTGEQIVGVAGFPHDEVVEDEQVQNIGVFKSLEVHGKTSSGLPVTSYNMFNRDWEIFGAWISKTGVLTQDDMSCYTEPIPVVGGNSYRLSFMSRVHNNKRLHAYDSNETWLYQVCEFLNTDEDRYYTKSFTLRDDVAYLKFSYRPQDEEILLCEGSEDRIFAPYGGIRILVTTANLNPKSPPIDVDLQGYELESNGDDEDILTIEADGSCSIQPLSGKTAPTLANVQIPPIAIGDILYTLTKEPAVLTLTSSMGGGIVPTGTLNIFENGTYDVTNYEFVTISV